MPEFGKKKRIAKIVITILPKNVRNQKRSLRQEVIREDKNFHIDGHYHGQNKEIDWTNIRG
jgi:hypothetical protein